MQTGCLQQYCQIHLIWLDQYDLVWVRSQVKYIKYKIKIHMVIQQSIK